jgi:hypothetical protein
LKMVGGRSRVSEFKEKVPATESGGE